MYGLPYRPTHPDRIRPALKLANLKADELPYDLDSGDGRVLVIATREFGAKVWGMECTVQLEALFAGFQYSTVQMFQEIKAHNALRLGTQFEIPFFVFQGESDVITLASLAEEYFSEIDAPIKKISLIKDAGHFAAFTNADQFLSELLSKVRPLAVDQDHR